MAMVVAVAAGIVVLVALAMVALHLRVHGARRTAFRTVNSIMILLLRAGVPFGSMVPAGTMMLLTVVGRKTGVARTTPVDVYQVKTDERRWVMQTHGSGKGASDWVRNLRVAGEATVGRGRRSERFAAVELSEREAAVLLEELLMPVVESRFRMAVLHRAMPTAHDRAAEHFAAMARSHAVFELTPLPVVVAEHDDVQRAA